MKLAAVGLLAILIGFPFVPDAVAKPWASIPGPERFQVLTSFNGEAVLDKETELIWEKTPNGTFGMYQLAFDQCAQKTVGGKKGWRLPKVEELATLMDSSQSNPALPPAHPFTGLHLGTGESYWTNTLLPESSLRYIVGFFASGVISSGATSTGQSNVWCVRGGAN